MVEARNCSNMKRKEVTTQIMKVKMESKTIKKRKKLTTYEWQMYSLLVIPVLLVFVFSYLPMGGLVIAFKNYKYNLGIFGSEWIGLDNFKFFFVSDAFTRITWNTLYMNFIFIILGHAAAVLTAILLFEIKSRNATKVFQTVLITPHFVSWVIAAYIVYALLNPYGVVNGLIKNLGGKVVDWYTQPKYWPVILTICNLWKHIGMNSVMYYAGLMGMDSTLFEAAEVDGANKIKVIRYIVLPLLVPMMTILIILAIGGIFRADFGLFYNVPRNVGLLYSTTDVVDTYIFRAMREVGDMGMSSAVGFLQSVVGFVMVMFTNAVSKKINPDNALF